MEKNCFQKSDGPTPCFREAGARVCSLNFCPVEKIKAERPGSTVFSLLHSHCVMSENYGQQKDFDEGKGEFMAAIANNRK